MRNIAIFLLIANVVYFTWNLFRPEPEWGVTTQRLPPSGENMLVMLSELDNAPPKIMADEMAFNVQPQTLCISAGDFLDLNDASLFRDFVDSAGIESTLNLTEDLAKMSYQVNLPPFASRDSAISSLESITDAISDYGLNLESSVIPDGDFENGISFGSFETESEALNAQVQLANLGYIADIEQKSGIDTVIRVLIRAENSPSFESQIWPQIQNERPYLNRTENLCETIAQGGQFP